ncbi:LIM and calponin homology domains-containing protein 1-like isoform X2 [Corythoichthys intestinalis]|uniref:LIM and calponin homology domains-containing protein 1-like isoform X2 n=1 Tax=Corythoichthys intestinalis TaxID=161448 RepID=UPI0025A51846|nr:LIM and calponin homology domains-containing protein 1-like isoform X2 [Corythoichthys intestinalis]
MENPVAPTGQSHQHRPVTASAFREAQKWIEAVTGRSFGDRNFRGGLENGILLCELLSAIKPGLVKKINRLPTPIAGLDNLSVFLRGCEELGLKGSQLFDPGDLQDTSTRPATKRSDCTRKLKNVLITIYWLGRAANSCISYNGPTLDLREFEGLLSQMRKEPEEAESPQRSIRDSGYVDCWDSERSDSLSPPRHCREDSFDSLDSFGSRSQQTPSPDVLVLRSSSDGRGSDSESDGSLHRKAPDIHKDDMLARRTSMSEPRNTMPFNQYLPNKCNMSSYVPAPLRKKKESDTENGERKSWSTLTSPVGGEKPFRSVSLIDMRSQEDAAAILQPHSHVRHEMMHNQYNRLKEEDNHWQDDLARWKSRRRSISQDLIKKEEERKLMEQLMTGGPCISQRRRSIKTYREIVEDKERREEELRTAYRRAKTPEEASTILQSYAQRFSISETVMERLQLPKVLDRSISADPFLTGFPAPLTPSPTTSQPWDADGPMKYLRQQSAPAPRFTSTLEAQIADWPGDSSPHRPQIRSRSSEPPSNRALSPKPLPLLTPKPYFQSWPTTPEPWPSKAEDSPRVNGNAGGNDDSPTTSESQEREHSPVFLPSSSPKTTDHNTSTEGGSPLSANTEEVSSDVHDKEVVLCSTPPSRPTSLPEELHTPEEIFRRKSGRQSPVAPVEKKCESAASDQTAAETKQETVPSCPSSETSVMSIQSRLEENQKKEDVPCLGNQPPTTTEALKNSNRSPQTSSNPNLRSEFFADKGEKNHHSNVSVPVSPQARRADRWSWDPDEERKRQERWQQEQERLLQEKYQREQEKLKEEWEKAQKEVAQEERRYHEEERLILQETVAPLTPLSSASPASPGQDTIVRSLADWERKQQRLEKPSKEGTESVACQLRENNRTSDIRTVDDSVRTAKSAGIQSSCLQNGQKLHQKTSTSVRKRQEGDAGKSIRPAGDRRSHGPAKNPLRSGDTPPNRSVSGKKLCSSCGQPLGKGAAMIIETLSLYFHIDCFKCGVCKGHLGDTSTGTDVRIRSGLLNCNQCYIRSRSAGQPTTL